MKSLFFSLLFIFPTLTIAIESKTCAKLTEIQCLTSAECELALLTKEKGKNSKYICRPAQGRCEIGFIQRSDTQAKDCEAKSGCKHLPANCYCPPDLNCYCGGGEPSKCVEQKK